MKIFVKPNPFWEMIWWIILGLTVWTISSVIISKYNPDLEIFWVIWAGLVSGFMSSVVIFIIGGLFFILGRSIYYTYKESYPKKPKKQQSNAKDQIRTIQYESNYEVNKYKNNLKSIL